MYYLWEVGACKLLLLPTPLFPCFWKILFVLLGNWMNEWHFSGTWQDYTTGELEVFLGRKTVKEYGKSKSNGEWAGRWVQVRGMTSFNNRWGPVGVSEGYLLPVRGRFLNWPNLQSDDLWRSDLDAWTTEDNHFHNIFF